MDEVVERAVREVQRAGREKDLVLELIAGLTQDERTACISALAPWLRQVQADPPRWTVQARHARVQRAENRVDADLDGETHLRLDAHGLVTSQGTMREATAATCAFPGCFTQAVPVRRAGSA